MLPKDKKFSLGALPPKKRGSQNTPRPPCFIEPCYVHFSASYIHS